MHIKTTEEIATTKRLTKEILVETILPQYKNNPSKYFKQRKVELLSDFGAISSIFDMDTRVVVYCFLKMWEDGIVRGFNFAQSFENNRFKLIPKYLKHYYDAIEPVQLTL